MGSCGGWLLSWGRLLGCEGVYVKGGLLRVCLTRSNGSWWREVLRDDEDVLRCRVG